MPSSLQCWILESARSLGHPEVSIQYPLDPERSTALGLCARYCAFYIRINHLAKRRNRTVKAECLEFVVDVVDVTWFCAECFA